MDPKNMACTEQLADVDHESRRGGDAQITRWKLKMSKGHEIDLGLASTWKMFQEANDKGLGLSGNSRNSFPILYMHDIVACISHKHPPNVGKHISNIPYMYGMGSNICGSYIVTFCFKNNLVTHLFSNITQTCSSDGGNSLQIIHIP